MTPDQLSEFCLQFRGSAADYPFGPVTCTFKVHGKIFALSSLASDPLQVSLKCEPDLAVVLRQQHAGINPGYHLNKRHWNTVTVDEALADHVLCALIEDSYDLVVATLPKKVRLALGAVR